MWDIHVLSTSILPDRKQRKIATTWCDGFCWLLRTRRQCNTIIHCCRR